MLKYSFKDQVFERLSFLDFSSLIYIYIHSCMLIHSRSTQISLYSEF